MNEAREIVREHGFRIEAFPAILAILRNPYDSVVSAYAYQKERMKRLGEFTADFTFKEFVDDEMGGLGTKPQGRHFKLFHLDGAMPVNLRIIRFENLAAELTSVLDELGIERREELPWVNRSERGHFTAYYDRATEAAVYEASRWIFEGGYYRRLEIG